MPNPSDGQSRLQPAKPTHYRLPSLVQPQWYPSDLWVRHHIDEAEALRQKLCKNYGVRHCLLLDRARSGLYLLCKAFGLNDEWITTSLMHRPSMVLLSNHTSRIAFADVDVSLTIDPESVERLISPHSCAILATHTYGKVADVVALRNLADRHGLALIENAVHMASGRTVGGRPIGSWGDATLLSFNVDKPLGGILGGALLTNRDDIWNAVGNYPLGPANTKEMRERIRTTYLAYRLKPLALRLLSGQRHRAESDGVEEIESVDIRTYQNYTSRKIHPRQTRVALAGLEREASMVEKRGANAALLNARLCKDPRFVLPESTPERPHTYTYYPLLLQEGSRIELGRHLARAGIESKWRLAPLHAQAGFLDTRGDRLDHSEMLWRQHLLLPAGASTTPAQIDYLADTILSW